VQKKLYEESEESAGMSGLKALRNATSGQKVSQQVAKPDMCSQCGTAMSGGKSKQCLLINPA
jgi:hypothetical protein